MKSHSSKLAPDFEPITGPTVDAWLTAQGLEVVAAMWGGAGAYRVALVKRVTAPPLEPCAACGHSRAVHEDSAGLCLAVRCGCEVYCPPLEVAP